jgi:serine/threonine-protein kinase RsbW
MDVEPDWFAMAGDLTLELPTDLRAIEVVVASMIEQGRNIGFNPDRLRLNLRVGLTEALTNAMLYGNRKDPDKRVRILARFSADEISIVVTDEGHGFDPDGVPDPTTPANIRRARGRGIFMIRQLMDHVEYNTRGNSVRLKLTNGPGGPIAHAS